VEAETARLVGLNPFQLEEEEQAMLPKNVNPGSYVKVESQALAEQHGILLLLYDTAGSPESVHALLVIWYRCAITCLHGGVLT
jgi:hypothetical protein